MIEGREEELDAMYRQYKTVKDTIKAIDDGAALIAIITPGKTVDTEDIFDNPNYLKQMRGDLLYYRQDLRHQLIDILQKEDAGELGIDISEVEPFPVGTPKNDYRKHGTDTDDGR